MSSWIRLQALSGLASPRTALSTSIAPWLCQHEDSKSFSRKMALQERHRWMAANVAAAFGMSDRVHVVEQVLGEYNNLKKLNDFLEGKSKHKHVFVYYQRPDVINDANELVDAKGDAQAHDHHGRA